MANPQIFTWKTKVKVRDRKMIEESLQTWDLGIKERRLWYFKGEILLKTQKKVVTIKLFKCYHIIEINVLQY